MPGHQRLEFLRELSPGIIEELLRRYMPLFRESLDIIFVNGVGAMVGKLPGNSAARKT
jgi:hypothetical protein